MKLLGYPIYKIRLENNTGAKGTFKAVFYKVPRLGLPFIGNYNVGPKFEASPIPAEFAKAELGGGILGLRNRANYVKITYDVSNGSVKFYVNDTYIGEFSGKGEKMIDLSKYLGGE